MRLDLHGFMLFLKHLHDLLNDLIGQIVDMRSTFNGTDGVDEADLLKLTITH
jgi:hypothetical protein